MLRLTSLANKYQKRTLRVLYGNTQAYPYDAQLDPSFDRTQGALAGSNSIAGALAAILPGQVAVKKAGEVVTPVGHAWATSTYDYRAFGLFGEFVGGTLSDIDASFDRVGVWRGIGSVYEILAPVFDDTGLASNAAAEDGTGAQEVYLTANTKAQLTNQTVTVGPYISPGQTARLLNRLSSNAIIVELLV